MYHVVSQQRTVAEKLEILADAAKYDVACTSSGVTRAARKGDLGSASSAGCCHSFTPDGRCITLLKVLMTNVCIYDCAYCINRSTNNVERTAFTPRELADLTIAFYRRNYIEGLFLSSGVIGSPDHTTELMIQTLRLLREEHRFRGYIHAKAIPGTSPELIEELGLLCDRMSVNMELPSQQSLNLLAPEKSGLSLLGPMRQIAGRIAEDKETRASLPAFQMARRKSGSLSSPATPMRDRAFVPAGQSTQMIIGATPETDYAILNLSGALYAKMNLKRVFFSAYVPVNRDKRLPDSDQVQLDREHRLFQADWLLRFYGFEVDEIIDEEHPMLDLLVDPKANWALNHLDEFPVEVNTADLEMLMRVPGIGALGARRIIAARRSHGLGEMELKRLGIAFKRARYFVTCNGKWLGDGIEFSREVLRAQLAAVPDGGRHGRRDPRRIPGQMAFGDIDPSFNLSAGPVPIEASAGPAKAPGERELGCVGTTGASRLPRPDIQGAKAQGTEALVAQAGNARMKRSDPLAGWCA